MTNDPHPQAFEVEIDRPRLRRYLRSQTLLIWMYVASFGGAFYGIAQATELLEASGGFGSISEMVLAVGLTMGSSLIVSWVVGALAYLLVSHWRIPRLVEALEVSVDGAFLRTRSRPGFGMTSDRKFHFRSIVDYGVEQGWLMRRCGVEALHMTTMAGGQHNSGIRVVGVKDAERIRDLLSEVDSLRELP